ncbi:putative Curli production assembly/transport component CsgG [Tenacibaculum sp. 190524A02b]|uniref:FlgO family outer membrane protein n=1 Tax=Tenacibaculum vairaonense TaxID=3137860 RepID=UPI0032B1753A
MKLSLSTITFIIFFYFSHLSHSQEYSNFDKAMISISKELASRIKKKGKIKIGVWDFTNSLKKTNELGNYVRDDFSIHFTNASDGMEVITREELNILAKEHDLNLEAGLIDPKTAKKVGMIHAADAVITGTVDAGIHRVRIRIKVIDTQTGIHFAAALRNIPIDNSMKITLQETGFYKPVKLSNDKRVNNMENENNSRSTNKKCQTLGTGDYCFSNTSQNMYGINIYGNRNNFRKTASVYAGQDVCFYDLPEGTYEFKLFKNNLRTTLGPQTGGTFRIEKCQSLSYKISDSKNLRRTKR